MSGVKFDDEVQWDGRSLSVWAETSSGRILCVAPREAIDCLPIYNDAIGREIEQERSAIVQKLKPCFVSKIKREIHARDRNRVVCLAPSDIHPALTR